ncbi:MULTISPECIES: YceI family protein [Pseudoalteromonas]|uniref:YceI family protein n=1 Tax=Pseudoalteromonas TaxID=53246 RepID=UPI000FFE4EB3|nr:MULTISPECIES: YceI family protein [Pseudoalteromonas]MCG9757876.1 YceI family protein [Pseudoalteromonas sp. Isolate6]NKC20682.1 YceI family protein [Pseudoalteromonas galatheae]RXE88170.1 YceI family protein [Pseudoalteromonas sp. A757]
MLKYLLLGSALISSQAFAAWQFNQQQSDVSFVSVKQTSVAEVHHFKTIDSTLSAKGELEVNIDLASVETMIPIRNERMQKMLFNVAQHPKAKVNADVSEVLAKLKVGTQKINDVTATLTLHGQIQKISLDLLITKSANGLVVTPVHAFILDSKQFGLDKGIEALREIAGLKTIATSVPVSFNLVFDEQN